MSYVHSQPINSNATINIHVTNTHTHITHIQQYM